MLWAACEADRASLSQPMAWCALCRRRPSQDGEDYANSINALFLEASARTGANVQQIFEMAGTARTTWPEVWGARRVLTAFRAAAVRGPAPVRKLPALAPAAPTTSASVTLTETPAKKKGGCC